MPPRLSDDLWYMIFEVVELDVPILYNKPHPILALVLVCKRWKAIVTPLMYRSVVPFTESNIQRLARHLAGGYRSIGAPEPGPLVRHFQFWPGRDFPKPISRTDIISIIAMCQNLRSFATARALPQEIAQLTAASALSLRALTLRVPGSDDVTPFLPAIQDLKQLRRLHLHQGYRRLNLPETIDDQEPLCLPHLLDLDVDLSDAGGDSIMAHIFRGRYPSLGRLHLYDMENSAVDALRLFLGLHGPLLRRIDLILWYRVDVFSIFPNDALSSLETVSFEGHDGGRWPSPEWYSHLPPSVFHFRITEYALDEPEPLLEHLDAVASGQFATPVKEIHIEGFGWGSLFVERADEAEPWIRCAQRLHERKGISLLDSAGLQWNNAGPPRFE